MPVAARGATVNLHSLIRSEIRFLPCPLRSLCALELGKNREEERTGDVRGA